MGAARTARKQDNLRKAAPCHLSGTRPPQARQTSHPRHHANAAVPPPPRPSQDQVRISPPRSSRSYRAGISALAQPGKPRACLRHPGCSAIYRHVHATGLYAKRRRNALQSLELIIEHAADIVPTANEVTNAVRACSRLNDEARWIDPPKRHIVVHVDEHANPLRSPGRSRLRRPPRSPQTSTPSPKRAK